MAFDASQWMTPSGGGYEIDNSLRFDSASSAKLTNTFASAGNRRTFSFSTWVKRSTVTGYNVLFGIEEATDGSAENLLFFDTTNGNIRFGWNDYTRSSAALFRDVSGWYHVLLAVDTTDATAQDRIKMYVNGVQITVWAASSNNHPDENEQFLINKASEHHIGIFPRVGAYANVYMAETHFIDGAAKTPADFGESGDYGEFKPIEYEGAYGDEGFYLDFKSSGVGTASSSTVGADRSGNTNHWTSTNLAATDQMLDSPTNNFATFNPLETDLTQQNPVVFSEGNLFAATPSHGNGNSFTTIGVTSGKFYAEILHQADSGNSSPRLLVGVSGDTNGTIEHQTTIGALTTNLDVSYHSQTGIKFNNNTEASYGDSFAVDDIIGIALNADDNEVTFYKNNSSQGAIALAAGGTYHFAIGDTSAGGGGVAVLNCGQDSSFSGNETAQGNTDGNGIGDFYYAPPSGFLALCTSNLPDVAVVPSEHFNTVIYTGNATARNIDVGFQSDFTWVKARSLNYSHRLVDSVRGAGGPALESNNANAEITESTGVTAFNSSGFALGTAGGYNENNGTFVAWNWKAGNSNTAFSESGNNPAGTHRANVDAGFSIVSYVGTGATGTVAHGLGVAPELIIIKNRDVGDSWAVYYGDNTDYLVLDTTTATADDATRWNDTSPSATVFTVNTSHSVNADAENYIAYCWRSVDGYSKVGSYFGNGNVNGTFIYTGFKPMFVLTKNFDAADDWSIADTSRSPHNLAGESLRPNSNSAEDSAADIDILSNGFKLRAGDSHRINYDAETFIYLAFAETPFKYSNAR